MQTARLMSTILEGRKYSAYGLGIGIKQARHETN